MICKIPNWTSYEKHIGLIASLEVRVLHPLPLISSCLCLYMNGNCFDLSDCQAKQRAGGCMMLQSSILSWVFFCRIDSTGSVVSLHITAGSIKKSGYHIHMWMNIAGCIWQLSKNVILPVSPASFTVCFGDNILDCARCKLRLISHYPVEESVTFKMAYSQGSLPVIRDVYYGLWSHPVNICIGVCVLLCKLKVSLSVESYLALWHEPAFPFSLPYNRPSIAPMFLIAWRPLYGMAMYTQLGKWKNKS